MRVIDYGIGRGLERALQRPKRLAIAPKVPERKGAEGRKKPAPAFGPQAKRCRELPCVVCQRMRKRQPNPTEAHHEPPRSRGGKDRDTVPLCGSHHRQRHRMGALRFWRLHGIDWPDVVRRMRDPLNPSPDTDAIPW